MPVAATIIIYLFVLVLRKNTSLQSHIITNLSIIQSSYSSSDFLLRFGDFDKDAASEEIPTFDRGVSTVIPHERFDYYTFEYDIALLKTDAPVEFSPTVRPVCLPEDNGQVDGEIGYITGWGTTAEGETVDQIRICVSPMVVI